MDSKRVLVPGGGGYIGSRLVPALLDAGYEVTVIDTFWFGNHLGLHPNLTCIEHDLRKPIRSGYFDSIIHLACISNDPSFELNPKIAKEINLDAFRNFVDAAISAKVERFVYASSSSVYGVCNEPADETHALEPLTDYSRYKVECEKILRDSGLPYVILRPATACGVSPRMRFDTMLNSFVNQAVNSHSISVWGGTQMRSHINISELVRFYLLALEAPEAVNRTFNVSTVSMSIMELAGLVANKTDGCIIKLTTSDDRRSYQVDAGRAARELGFLPVLDIDFAIDRIMQAMPFFTDPLNNPMYFNLKRMKEIYG